MIENYTITVEFGDMPKIHEVTAFITAEVNKNKFYRDDPEELPLDIKYDIEGVWLVNQNGKEREIKPNDLILDLLHEELYNQIYYDFR
jgi:hypothetical protein